MSRQGLSDRVRSSGLQLVELVSDSSILGEVWARVISGNAVPEVRISDVERVSALKDLAARWVECMRLWGVADEGENFLIGLPGSPPEVALVSMVGKIDVSPLGYYSGEPEFVASNLDRSIAVGVTIEEGEFWLIRADLGGEREVP